jgi:hypothetical protein
MLFTDIIFYPPCPLGGDLGLQKYTKKRKDRCITVQRSLRLLKSSTYLAAGLAVAAFLLSVFFTTFLEEVLLFSVLVVVVVFAGCCFTTGEAKEMLPKRRALARIKLNFFMTFIFFSYYY